MARRGGWRRRGKKRFRYEDARGGERSPIRRSSPGSTSSSSRLPGRRSGSRPTRGRSCRQRASTRPGGSSTSTTRITGRRRSRRSTTASCASASFCPRCGRRWRATCCASRSAPSGRLAHAVALINRSWFRVGSETYARGSRTYGVSTLRKRHVDVRGTRLRFTFRAKHRTLVRATLVDPELADAIKELREPPGRVASVPVRGRERPPRT